MNHDRSRAIIFSFLLILSFQAFPAPTQWLTGSGANGHYYDLVLGSKTWTASRDAAAASSFLGSSGHLVTITSAAENEFVRSTFDASSGGFVWIGASDAAVEGQWRWMVGPEAGTQFWQGNASGAATAPYFYANWGPIEPNNASDEDVAALNLGATSGGGTLNGQWGDTDITTNFGGYIVEYSNFTSAIPEPEIYAMLVAGLGLLGFAARRKKNTLAF